MKSMITLQKVCRGAVCCVGLMCVPALMQVAPIASQPVKTTPVVHADATKSEEQLLKTAWDAIQQRVGQHQDTERVTCSIQNGQISTTTFSKAYHASPEKQSTPAKVTTPYDVFEVTYCLHTPEAVYAVGKRDGVRVIEYSAPVPVSHINHA